MKIFLATFIALCLTSSLHAKNIDITISKGTEQSAISSLHPAPAFENTPQNTVLKAIFKIDIDPSSVQKNNIKLKQLTKSKESIVAGTASYNQEDNSVMFTPEDELSEGFYEIEFKSLKALKSQKDQQIKEIKYRFKVIEAEIIDGHVLPPEPKNPDATLLGADTNNNGVRDEVERWIYKDMPTYYHPEIERVIAMQQAKADQMVLIDPLNANDIVVNAIHRGVRCWWYYHELKDLPMDGAVEKFNARLSDKSFNTEERLKTYHDYDNSLKGRRFTDSLETVDDCDTNIDSL